MEMDSPHCLTKSKWSKSEKQALLKALEKHGSEDVNKLKEYLPNKSKTAILQMIKSYQAIAELGKRNNCSPLDVWLRSGIFNSDSELIPEALLFISLLENHPPPEETAGFDLQKAYKFLYEITQAGSSTQLPSKTKSMLKDLVIQVDEEICLTTEPNIVDYLYSKLPVESDNPYKRRRID